ncbi:folate family ECF transporter S component [Caldisalinibacter kiritimatiensis]|uniref:Substrate-specific component FolT of folate ECF transporter n=1 Tax=Caldisalinibacter kiritimatiensis TaxID=1304284 RepID=R1AXG0_9FIRM|nr:folate family ECF transporter S component [Caldisalinibacter kiritimatiensis]EOD01342.1 Substrate-specific component FolT of folate ECF transporter [Caldisalinibacter kiritimatiensis]
MPSPIKVNTKALVGTALLAAISVVLLGAAIMVPLAGLPALRLSFFEIPIIIAGMLFGPLAGGLCGIIADLLGFLLFPKGAFFPGFTLSAALWGVIPGIIFKFMKSQNKKFNYSIVNVITTLILAAGVINILIANGVLKSQDGTFFIYDSKLTILHIALYLSVVLAFIIVPIIASKKAVIGIYSLDKLSFIVTITYLIISLGLNTYWLSIMFNKGFIYFLPGRIIAGLVVIPLHSTILYILSKTFKYIK